MIKKKEVFFIIVIFVIIASAFGINYFNSINENSGKDEIDDRLYCETDADCVPDDCCHPSSCVNVNYKPDCSATLCSAVCQPDTLDCGQGSCLCINNKCGADIK